MVELGALTRLQSVIVSVIIWLGASSAVRSFLGTVKTSETWFCFQFPQAAPISV